MITNLQEKIQFKLDTENIEYEERQFLNEILVGLEISKNHKETTDSIIYNIEEKIESALSDISDIEIEMTKLYNNINQ